MSQTEQTIEQKTVIPYMPMEDILLKSWEAQRETAIKNFKEDYCPLCANYNSATCKGNNKAAFTGEGNCWFYTTIMPTVSKTA